MCMNGDGKYDNDFYVAGNTDIYDVTITLPSPHKGKKWYLAADTSIECNDCIAEPGKEECLSEQKRYILPAGSFVVLMSK